MKEQNARFREQGEIGILGFFAVKALFKEHPIIFQANLFNQLNWKGWTNRILFIFIEAIAMIKRRGTKNFWVRCQLGDHNLNYWDVP
jgi:hypothetical protein